MKKAILKVIVCVSTAILFMLPGVVGVDDPSDENPTDTSITIKINDASFNVKDKDGSVEITLEITGETTGSVHHCGIAFVTYYKNGTTSGAYFIPGPFSTSDIPPEYRPENITFEFKGTGADGSWSTWRFYEKVISEKGEDEFEEFNVTKEEIKSIKIWARAYSDKAGTLWNQGSKDVTKDWEDKIEKYLGKEDKNGGGGTPGFEFAFLIIAIIASMILLKRRKKRNQ